MARRILDTSVLVAHWSSQRGRSSRPPARDDVVGWAANLIDVYRCDTIVSPVYVEFICGARTSEELALFEAYLSAFDVVDQWKMTETDMAEAARIARRIPRDGQPRQVGDCLIRAIANRMRYDVLTVDRRFPRTR